MTRSITVALLNGFYDQVVRTQIGYEKGEGKPLSIFNFAGQREVIILVQLRFLKGRIVSEKLA